MCCADDTKVQPYLLNFKRKHAAQVHLTADRMSRHKTRAEQTVV